MTDTALPPLTRFSLVLKDHVAHLRLNQPGRMNTMDGTFWRELEQVLNRLHRSGEARALVISSEGKHFSAGMDLSVFTSSGLKEACKGYEIARITNALMICGALEAGGDGRPDRVVKVDGRSVRLYCIDPDLLDGGENAA